MSKSGSSGAILAAADHDLINQAAAQVLVQIDTGVDMTDAQAVTIDGIAASSVLLVNEVVDDSGSIESCGNTQVICDGDKLINEGIKGSKSEGETLKRLSFINHGQLYDFRTMDQVPELVPWQNFHPDGMTPFFDAVLESLARLVKYLSDGFDVGVPVRSVSWLATDGADNASKPGALKKCKTVIESLLKTEQHIIGGIGIDDKSTDFRQVFRDMGIQDKWILTPKNTPSEIRKAFGLASKSTARASQSAGHFSQTNAGGFAAVTP